jgi:hypothetical protein
MSLRFRVIEKRNFHGSMEMSFLSHALYVMQCQAPIKRGTLRPPVKGHEIKKTFPYSFSYLVSQKYCNKKWRKVKFLFFLTIELMYSVTQVECLGYRIKGVQPGDA